jgi:hypothetical protein
VKSREALVPIAADLRTVLASHMALELVDRSGLRSTHGRQINGGMQIASGASDFEIAEAGV